MSDETKDVNTQEEDLNTEANLEENNVEDDSINNESNEYNLEEYEHLSDEDFEKYLNKIEGSKGNKNESTSRDTTDTSTDSSQADSNSSGKDVSDTSSDTRTKPVGKQSDDTGIGESGDDKSKTGKEKEGKTKEENVDYESVYKEIFKPFKANGKEITPKTVQDVISLMQMGSNYTKKMQSMSPMRKAYESLNKAEIGDDELNFLIDLHKGDKEAIKKLLEKHKVDPLDLNMDETNYVPNNNLVSKKDVEYSDVLDDIQSSLPKIQEIITKTWDEDSKKLLLEDHNLMRALHEEIQYGRFDEVQARLEIEKTFGRYKGIPDIQAYHEIVNKMLQEKTSNNTNNTNTNSKPTNTPNKNVPDKSKAAPTKGNKSIPQDKDSIKRQAYAMNDDDFEKNYERLSKELNL